MKNNGLLLCDLARKDVNALMTMNDGSTTLPLELVLVPSHIHYYRTMTKILSLLCLVPLAQAWTEYRLISTGYRVASKTSLQAKQSSTENPCWQDIYDEDCSMDSTYAASFVASEWLKRMPCAEGMEVRTK